MIKAVIIDFDDTLCLTEAACFAMENETLVAMGRVPMSREVHVSTWSQPLFDVITVRSPGIDVEAFKEAYYPILADYTKNGKLDTISQENYEALDEITRMGKLLFVLTSRTHSEVKHLLEPDHLLTSHIKAFYHKDNTAFHKPDPRVFNELFLAYDLEPESCVYVGDSIGDTRAAKQAGLRFVASLESGLRQQEDFSEYEVDAFIDRFSDLAAVIAEL